LAQRKINRENRKALNAHLIQPFMNTSEKAF